MSIAFVIHDCLSLINSERDGLFDLFALWYIRTKSQLVKLTQNFFYQVTLSCLKLNGLLMLLYKLETSKVQLNWYPESVSSIVPYLWLWMNTTEFFARMFCQLLFKETYASLCRYFTSRVLLMLRRNKLGMASKNNYYRFFSIWNYMGHPLIWIRYVLYI